jgi:hypothetical protein
MANCGLTNALTDVHSEQVPNTHVRGSKQIDFALVIDGIRPCIKAFGLLDESILKSDHRAIFLDLDLSLLFGTSLERLERPQFRNMKLDDPRISDSYLKLIHKEFECHNIYKRVWTRRTANNGIRHIDDRVLDHFLEHSDVGASYFDITMTVKECASELRNAKAKFKDVLDEATSNEYLYEVEVATAWVERIYPHLVEDNVMQAQEREE